MNPKYLKVTRGKTKYCVWAGYLKFEKPVFESHSVIEAVQWAIDHHNHIRIDYNVFLELKKAHENTLILKTKNFKEE